MARPIGCRAVHRARVATVLAIVFVSACSGGGKSAPTSTPPTDSPVTDAPSTTAADDATLPRLDDIVAPVWKPTTRTDELEMALSHGNLTVQEAVDAFSVTYLPMPGATPSSLPAGPGLGSHTALRLIEAARDQLAPEQLAVLDSLDAGVQAWAPLSAGSDGSGATAPSTLPSTLPSTTAAVAGFRKAPQHKVDPILARDLPLLHIAYDDWHKYKPHLPQPPVELEISSTQLKADVDMDTLYPAPSATLDGSKVCRIRVFPHLSTSTDQSDDKVLITSFAHELFHCAQDWWNPAPGFPDWLAEGSASFAAFDMLRGSFSPPDRYADEGWFADRESPLGKRAYDAWPLFETFLQYGGDPYAAVEQAFTGGGPLLGSSDDHTAAWLQLAGLDNQNFRSVWSANELRSTTFPEKVWTMKWPSTPELGPRDNQSKLPTHDVGTYSLAGSADFGQDQFLVPIGPKVGLAVVTATHGPLFTHSASGTQVIYEGNTLKFCFDTSACKCPSGLTAGALTMDVHQLVFSFAAAQQSGTSDVVALPWDASKFCAKPEKKTAQHNGDPHLRSFAGQTFDLMAPGEFVAARDDRGGFEVQVRNQVMSGHGTGTSVVALGTGAHRIVFGGDLAAPANTTLAVDAKAADMTAEVDVGDVKVTPAENNNWSATWPDGSVVNLHWNHGWFVTVALDAARAAHVTGLLGDANGNALDDLRLADGTHVDPADRTTLDERYAPQWYVAPSTSLFDYKAGETTFTFRVRPPDPPTIDPKFVASCAAGMTPDATSAEVNACAYDVAVTGDNSFVTAYTQVVTERVAADPVSAAIHRRVAPPADGPAPSGSSVTLSGTLASDTGGAAGVVDQLTASIEVKEGSIILGQAQLCAPGRDVSMRATLRGTNHYADAHLCDPSGFNLKSHDTDQVVAGEASLWATKGGTYDIRVTTSSDQPLQTSVTVSTDPTPTIVDAPAFASKGFTGHLAGRGDTIVLLINTGTKFQTWTSTGMDKACGDAQFGADPLGGGALMGIGVCGHTAVVNGSPNGDVAIPFVIYAHTDDPVDVTFVPQPG